MKSEIVVPIITLLIGWFLNEAGYWRRSSKEDRRNIAKAIADLLEIRHRFIVPKLFFTHFAENLHISPQESVLVKEFLGSILPKTDDLRERYEDTVSLIASIDPILGFQLRSKPMVGPMLDALKSYANNEPGKIAYFRTEDTFVELFVPYLEGLILELAKRHSRKTRKAVEKIFRDSTQVPKEIEQLLLLLQKTMHVSK